MASNAYGWEEVRLRLEVKIAECIREILSKDSEVLRYVNEAVVETNPREKAKKLLFIYTFIKSVFTELAENKDIESYTEDEFIYNVMKNSYLVSNEAFIKNLENHTIRSYEIYNDRLKIRQSLKASEAGRVRIEYDCIVSFEQNEDDSGLYNIKVAFSNMMKKRIR